MVIHLTAEQEKYRPSLAAVSMSPLKKSWRQICEVD
jgi:hypothetical protein